MQVGGAAAPPGCPDPCKLLPRCLLCCDASRALPALLGTRRRVRTASGRQGESQAALRRRQGTWSILVMAVSSLLVVRLKFFMLTPFRSSTTVHVVMACPLSSLHAGMSCRSSRSHVYTW